MKNYKSGQNLCVASNVEIGEGTVIGNNVTIYDNTKIGSNVIIDDNVVLGKLPKKAVLSATTSTKNDYELVISDNCKIGTSSIIYSGAILKNNVFVGDLVTIRENVKIEENTIIGRGCTIENIVEVGKNCKIQSNCHLVPYSKIGNFVFIGPGFLTSNDNFLGRTEKRFSQYKGIEIEDGARIGVGVITLPGVNLGSDCLVGAGSLVTSNVPSKKIYFGIPARLKGDVKEEELLENQ